MSRLKFDPFAIAKYPTRAAFPASGVDGFLYKAEDTGSVYLCKNGGYESFNSGTILDETGTLMPRRGSLQFASAGIKVTDNEADDKTVVSFEYLKPFHPSPLAPENGGSGMALFVRLKITPYVHPVGIPIGGVHWQVAADEDFTAVVFDQRLVSASDSVVITEDEMTVPYLTAGTEYFWRARYFDLMDTDSDWSEVWSFETDAGAITSAILQPDIIYPHNGKWSADRRLYARLSDPVVIGALTPDKLDLQIAIAPDFLPGNILEEYLDYNDATTVIDGDADFRSAPDTLYIRGRQKDSVNSDASAWSPVSMFHVQKLYSGDVIGFEKIIKNGSTMTRWIDETGEPVSVGVEYWGNNPIFSAIHNENIDSKSTYQKPNVMTFIPQFYVKTEVTKDGLEDQHYKYWFSADARDGYALHPAFTRFPHGFFISSATCGVEDGEFVSRFDAAGTTTSYAQAQTYLSAWGGGQNLAKTMSIYEYMAVNILMMLEKSTTYLQAVSTGTGNDNSATCFSWRGIRSWFGRSVEHSAINLEGIWSPSVTQPGYIQIGGPLAPGTAAYTCYFNQAASSTMVTLEIDDGYEDGLGFNKELLFMAKSIGVASGINQSYFHSRTPSPSGVNAMNNSLNQDSGSNIYAGMGLTYTGNMPSRINRFVVDADSI
jgi:hypothetical protein